MCASERGNELRNERMLAVLSLLSFIFHFVSGDSLRHEGVWLVVR